MSRVPGLGVAVAALAAISLLLTACLSTVPRSPAERAADSALANRVYLALNADPVFFYRHVDVRVNEGVADLSGYVWTSEAIYHARQVARAVPGVTGVVTSQLELEREGRGSGVTR